MDIQEFLESCSGNWFSQRSSYHIAPQQGISHKSELAIEWLTPDHPDVVKHCQIYQIDPKLSLGGQKVTWDTSIDWGQTKRIGSSVLVFVPDEANSATGNLLNGVESSEGRYELKSDLSLYLTLAVGEQSIVERIWFASPNLRLRTSIVKNQQKFAITSFYSEIRKLT